MGAPPTGGALLWGPGGKWRPEGSEAALAARRPVGPAGRGRAASGLVPAQRYSEEHEGNGEASSSKNNKKQGAWAHKANSGSICVPSQAPSPWYPGHLHSPP